MDISKSSELPACSRTQYGLTCQRWDQNWPHVPKNRPIDDRHNFCSRPDGDDRHWCYTTDPNVRWDYCHPKCEVITRTSATVSTSTPSTTSIPAETTKVGVNHVSTRLYGQCGAQNSNKIKSKISRYNPKGYCWDKCQSSMSSSFSTSFTNESMTFMSATGWKTSLSEQDPTNKIYYADDKATSFDFPWFVQVGMGCFNNYPKLLRI